VSASERAVREDLAALYRLVDRFWGGTDGIYNHVTLRLPEEPHAFLIKRHAHLFSEVTASNLVKVDLREELDERAGVNRPGFVLLGGAAGPRGRQLRGAHPHQPGHRHVRPSARPADDVAGFRGQPAGRGQAA
jgi:hypothetical protein